MLFHGNHYERYDAPATRHTRPYKTIYSLTPHWRRYECGFGTILQSRDLNVDPVYVFNAFYSIYQRSETFWEHHFFRRNMSQASPQGPRDFLLTVQHEFWRKTTKFFFLNSGLNHDAVYTLGIKNKPFCIFKKIVGATFFSSVGRTPDGRTALPESTALEIFFLDFFFL